MPESAASEGPSDQRSRDEQARTTTIRLLWVLAAAALLLPVLLFAFASWRSRDATEALADERLEHSLDVMQEQTLKVFQSMNLALGAIDNLLASKSAAEIAAAEPRLHEELRRIQGALPEVQSIWIFGPNGHPQVMTRHLLALAEHLLHFLGADAGGAQLARGDAVEAKVLEGVGERPGKPGKSGDWFEVTELRARPCGDLGRYGFAGDAVYRGESALHHWRRADSEHEVAQSVPIHASKGSDRL